MSKNSRQQIPPPVITPPSEARPAPATVAPVVTPAVGGDFDETPRPIPIAIAIVPPAERVAKVELLADRIILTNPTLILDRYVELGRDQRGVLIQKNKLTPALAVVMHGEIHIEELGLLIPAAAAVIRTF